MGVAGIGSSLGSVAMQYDFTKMTNKQLFNAVETLGSEGKISQTDASQLSFIAQGVDYTPISGPGQSVAQILSDPTQHNFIEEVQNDGRGASSAGGVGGTLYASMLNDLLKIQGASAETTKSSISVQP
jgi:hypothetical protein